MLLKGLEELVKEMEGYVNVLIENKKEEISDNYIEQILTDLT